MNKFLKEKLIKLAEEKQTKTDPSHDFQHVLRVFNLALQIGKKEQADLDVLIPAALLHDLVVYRKDQPNSKNSADESAELAGKILKNIKEYPKNKIDRVATCIKQCSFSKSLKPSSLESKILQDADGLDSTGAISIIRTASSGGQMNRQFYEPADPFCRNGAVAGRSDLDLFYRRLLIIEKRMQTNLAKRIAKRRTMFLKKFLDELKLELNEVGVI